MAADSCATAVGTVQYSSRFSSTLPAGHLGMKQKVHVEENPATAKTPPVSPEQLMKLFSHSARG